MVVSLAFKVESNFWFALSGAMPTPPASISGVPDSPVVRFSFEPQAAHIMIAEANKKSLKVFIAVELNLQYPEYVS